MFGIGKQQSPEKEEPKEMFSSGTTDEKELFKIPLKDKSILHVTNKRLVRSKKGRLEDKQFCKDFIGVPLESINCITPKRNSIMVQFVTEMAKHDSDTRRITFYDLGTDTEEAITRIKSTISAILLKKPNTAGNYIVRYDEKILKTAEATDKKEEGVLYITNNGICFEQKNKGLSMQMPFKYYVDNYYEKNWLSINYWEMHTDNKRHYYTCKLHIKNHIEKVSQYIQSTYMSSDAKHDERFNILKAKFEKLDGKNLKKILLDKRKDAPKISTYGDLYRHTGLQVTERSWELMEYIGMLAERMFGQTRPHTPYCYCSFYFQRDSLCGIRGGNELVRPGGHDWCGDLQNKTPLDITKWYTGCPSPHADHHLLVMEWRIVLCALLADVPLEAIGEHTESYHAMIKEFQQDFDEHRINEFAHARYKSELEEMESKSNDKATYTRIIKSGEYKTCKQNYEKYNTLRNEYFPKEYRWSDYNITSGELGKFQEKHKDIEWGFTEYRWEQKYAKRAEAEFLLLTRRIYDHWKKDKELLEFTDEKDYSWLKHILKEYPYTGRDAAIVPDLAGQMHIEHQRSESVKATLASFSMPKDIPKDDIMNTDCWYDAEHQMWWSKCEKAQLAASQATVLPDDARRQYNFAAFGFPKDKVKMMYANPNDPNSGVPVVELNYDIFPVQIPTDRFPIPPKKRRVVITAVPTQKITPEMIRDGNSTVRYRENAPYRQSLWISTGEQRETALHAMDNFKKTYKKEGVGAVACPLLVSEPFLEYETIEPEVAIMNGGMTRDYKPKSDEYALVSEKGTIYSGMRRGITADALPIAIEMDAERMGDGYPTDILPLSERLRRHLFVVTTLCRVLTKKEDKKDAEHEFAHRDSHIVTPGMLPKVDVESFSK